MDIDTIAKLIGIWGGVLSTFLAVAFAITGRRRVRVELDLDLKRSVGALLATDINHRPVTVVRVSITRCGG